MRAESFPPRLEDDEIEAPASLDIMDGALCMLNREGNGDMSDEDVSSRRSTGKTEEEDMRHGFADCGRS